MLFGAATLVAPRLADRWGRPAFFGSVAAAAIALIGVLILVSHVFWPLWAVATVVLYVVLAVAFPARIIERAVACFLAIAAVAISYEMGRLRYGIEWSTASLERPSSRVEGVLIGQNDRGVYLGVQSRRREGRLTVVFVPARRVARLETEPRSRVVNEPSARARREPIRLRIWHALK